MGIWDVKKVGWLGGDVMEGWRDGVDGDVGMWGEEGLMLWVRISGGTCHSGFKHSSSFILFIPSSFKRSTT